MVSDAAFLNEVEGFLASCELPVLLSTRKQRELHSQSTQNGADGEKKKNRDCSKDKSYYRRRKFERLNLRNQATELAAELEHLQQSNGTKKATSLSTWKALAKYQAQERANAEFENQQLCAAIGIRAAQIQDFFKLAQVQLSQLGETTELEIRLVNAASSGPFKRIRVDPPLDSGTEFYLNELDGATDRSSSGGESDNEVYRDSGQSFEHLEQDSDSIIILSVKTSDATKLITTKARAHPRLRHSVSVMATSKSNEEFLTEVERFLAACDLPTENAGSFSLNTYRNGAQDDTNRLLQNANGRKRSQTYQERKRAERDNLREQVKELTSKLATQKGKAGRKCRPLSPWKPIAKYQRDARFHAETQQRRLCATVDMRAKLIHAFRTCLNGKLDAELVEEFKLVPNEHKRTFEKSDTEIFATYVNDLDEIYAQTDKALLEIGPEPSIYGWIEGNKTGNYTFTKMQTVPSKFQETCRFLWQAAFMTHRQENRELFCDAEDRANTVIIKFRVTAQLNMGEVASVLQYVVTRRYQEDGRLVLVWRSFAEGEGIFTGMHADETGWCVASPSTNETVLRICMRHVPMHFRRVTAEAKQFKSFVFDTGVKDVFETTNKLEELAATEQFREEGCEVAV